MTLPPRHELERLRRRLTELVQAEQYLDGLEDALMADGTEWELRDRPRRAPTEDSHHADGTHQGETHIGNPYQPDRDLELMLEVFDYAIERSSKCPSP